MSAEKQLTPLMRQYFDVKAQYPDTILLFQVGDFYELFFEDAVKASAILGIALTKRGFHKQEPIPLCGVPLHVLDHYLTKLVRAGFKVALCDQLEIPKPGKLVDRQVTQVLTPGTLTDSKLLDDKSASYLCVFFPTETSWAMLCAELLTGQLFATIFSSKNMLALEAELSRFMPDEIVLPQTKLGHQFASSLQGQGHAISLEPFGGIHSDEALSWFEMQQGRQQGATHGVEGQPPMEADSRSSVVHKSDSLKGALTILYTYLKRNNEQGLKQLKQCSFYKPEDYLMLDASTVRNLELVKNSNDGSSSHTLFSVIDRAVTAMGSRMLKKWLLRPLIKRERIEERLNAVTTFVHTSAVKKDLRDMFSAIGDLERTVGRVALRRARLYDYRALTDALAAIPDIKKQVMHCQNDATLIKSLAEKIDEFHELTELLQNAIVDDPGKDMLIKEGYNAELDRLRSLMHGGAQEIAALEEREIKRTGINSLKIRYNSVHGYGIEVTTPNLHLVPLDYLRIQTLANRERFTTQELKNLEHDLQRAQTEIAHIEKQLFEGVKQAVEEYVPQLKRLSFSLASLDALAALAEVAYTQKYVRPTFNEERQLLIQDGRHPVVEQRMQLARKLSRESAHTPQSVVSDHEDGGRQHAAQYIPNSVDLTPEGPLWLITGPNMGGKSTFLRQVALTVLMAQMGSYVPASRAHVSIVDRIFTRIGASDNVAEGKSTFLVEMEETALVCNHATPHSLIILDEVGRGTSTFDGLAIAQAVVEYIYITLKAHCLFATHYHELTDLCTSHPGIRAHHAASMQTNEGVVLLHKILPGVADGSFGLEVASMARLPQPIIARARDIIAHLAQHGHATGLQNMAPAVIPSENTPENLPEFKAAQRLLSEIESINVDEITPKQALDLMWHFKELVRDR